MTQPISIEQALQFAWQRYSDGDLKQADAICRQILAADPAQTDAMSLLGLIVSSNGQFDEAIQLLQRTIELRPTIAVFHSRLGQVLAGWGHLDQAIAAHRKAVALQPEFADLHSDLGNALKLTGDFDAAIACYRHALQLSPDFATAHHNLGLILLLKGELKQGFAELDWRWRVPNLQLFQQQFSQPRWNGEPLNGRRILVRAEQGFGDAIHFARYIPLVQQLGGLVVFAVRPELFRLMSTLKGYEHLVTQGSPLVPFDLHCGLLDLPRILGTTLETIPNTVPYLSADPQLALHWNQKLNHTQPRGLRIGLVWSGLPQASNNRRRSVSLELLKPLTSIPNATFISLQKGDAANQTRTPPPGMKLLDWTAELNDFADTAALIANLDAVVTVDTVVAHLAGALGKPVYLLLAHVSDWQWMLARDDSPWYPTAKLYRQPAQGDWQTPIQRIVEALQRSTPLR